MKTELADTKSLVPCGEQMQRAPIMIQGTGSHAGKTTVVAGLCRLFARRGMRVAPFKSQNMSLNCFVTEKGEEIARATAVQAMGARQIPSVHMNPLLLKPKSDQVCELIVHGRPVMDVSASDYFLSDHLQELKVSAIRESISHLRRNYDLIVAEGAGSCAEPNLRALDVVNMGAAELLSADVYLLADLDQGGAFASLLGSLRVMELTRRRGDIKRIRGFLLNKFRGDSLVLKPGMEFLEQQTGIPVAGVLPYLHNLRLDEEDRITEWNCENPEIDIAILYLPHISNTSDFDVLAREEGVQVRFVKAVNELGFPDALIIPGTKNTIWDLDYLRRTGLEQCVRRLAEKTPVFGICGGFQMLAENLLDSEKRESELGSIRGMGLLPATVHFKRNKTVVNRTYSPTIHNPFSAAGAVNGFEIHYGEVVLGNSHALFECEQGFDGAVHPEKPIFGTFIHDMFSNPKFTRAVVNFLRARKSLPPLQAPLPDKVQQNELALETLADMLAASTKM